MTKKTHPPVQHPTPPVAQPQPKGAEDSGGPHLRKQAARLLAQLADNRPRRALDLDATRRLLEYIAAPADPDKLIASLTRSAWEWGVSCEIDDVRWGQAGDSHNQMWRDNTAEAASRLQAALLTAAPSPAPSPVAQQDAAQAVAQWTDAGEPANLAAAAEDAGEWLKLIQRLNAAGRWRFSEPDSLPKLRACMAALDAQLAAPPAPQAQPKCNCTAYCGDFLQHGHCWARPAVVQSPRISATNSYGERTDP